MLMRLALNGCRGAPEAHRKLDCPVCYTDCSVSSAYRMAKTKQEVVSEFRCSEILEAARKVFARKGFNGATVDEIAEAAGMAKGTVYLYFPSKRDVYLAALKRGLTTLIQETKRNVAAAATPADKLRAFIATRIQFAEENRDFAPILQVEFANLGLPHSHKEFRQLYLEQVHTLRSVLDEAIDRAQMRAVRTDAAAVMIYEMTRAVVMQRRMGLSKASLEEDVEMVLDLIWRGLAAGGGPCGASRTVESTGDSSANVSGDN